MSDKALDDKATPKSDKLPGDTRPQKIDAKEALKAQQKSALPTSDWPGKGAA